MTNTITTEPVKSVIPGSDKQMGPRNIPNYVHPDAYAAGEKPPESSSTGLVQAQFTVSNDENAVRLIKKLFANKLIASVNTREGAFHRTYLKFGKMETELGRDRLEMITTQEKVGALIDAINKQSLDSMSYPVPDVTILPITNANENYIAWVKKHIGGEGGLSEEVASA